MSSSDRMAAPAEQGDEAGWSCVADFARLRPLLANELSDAIKVISLSRAPVPLSSCFHEPPV